MRRSSSDVTLCTTFTFFYQLSNRWHRKKNRAEHKTSHEQRAIGWDSQVKISKAELLRRGKSLFTICMSPIAQTRICVHSIIASNFLSLALPLSLTSLTLPLSSLAMLIGKQEYVQFWTLCRRVWLYLHITGHAYTQMSRLQLYLSANIFSENTKIK